MIAQNRRLIGIVATAGILLLIPLIAMQFSTGVNWNWFDFLIAGTLLFGTGLLCELVLRKVTSARGRFILCGVILVLLVLAWAELAVGIFGTPLAGS